MSVGDPENVKFEVDRALILRRNPRTHHSPVALTARFVVRPHYVGARRAFALWARVSLSRLGLEHRLAAGLKLGVRARLCAPERDRVLDAEGAGTGPAHPRPFIRRCEGMTALIGPDPPTAEDIAETGFPLRDEALDRQQEALIDR